MEIKVTEKECWVCGSKKEITTHHTLPQHLKPKKNVLVPVCKECHMNKINSQDLAGLQSFAYKLEMELMRQISMWGNFRKSLGEFVAMEQKLLDAIKVKGKKNE